MSVRSAQMIGGLLRDRQENRRKMAALYNLRNQGTHGSSLSSMDQQKQDSALTEAGALYRKLLDRFWRHGAPRLECDRTRADHRGVKEPPTNLCQ